MTMTKEERLNIIQEVINNIKDDATREMYQSLPKTNKELGIDD